MAGALAPGTAPAGPDGGQNGLPPLGTPQRLDTAPGPAGGAVHARGGGPPEVVRGDGVEPKDGPVLQLGASLGKGAGVHFQSRSAAAPRPVGLAIRRR